MTTTQLRTAIVGCGVIGRLHMRAITAHPRFAVGALIDTDSTARARLRNEIDGTVIEVDSLSDLLDSKNRPEVVVVATPSGTHADLASAALSAGCHVIIEKPLDVNVTRALPLVRQANEAASRGQVTSVMSQRRFDPACQIVAKAIRDGRFGTITSGLASIAWWRGQDYYDSGAWRGTVALDGGGATMNQGIHTVDLLRSFLGRPVEIYAETGLIAHERIEVEDTAVATVRFESGALATILATTSAYPGISARVQVHGSRGSAVIEDDRLDYFHSAGNGASQGGYGLSGDSTTNQALDELPLTESSIDPREADRSLIAHLRQYDDIANAIDNSSRPLVDVNEAFLSLALVESIYRSAREHALVRFADVAAGL
jgi:predicted dehydrogenase